MATIRLCFVLLGLYLEIYILHIENTRTWKIICRNMDVEVNVNFDILILRVF